MSTVARVALGSLITAAAVSLALRWWRRNKLRRYTLPPSGPISGGSLIAQTLKEHGVRQLFALCGGHISPILVQAKQMGIRVIDVRHEASAVFAADAVSRLTSVPGVAAVTAGPGLTNTVTAIKNAQCAQSPLVLLTGTAPTVLRGKGALQDINQREVMAAHCKAFYTCESVSSLVPSLQDAFRVACAGVPGPVCLELPIDVLYPENLVRDWYFKKGSSSYRGVAKRLADLYLDFMLKRMHGGTDACRVGLPLPYHVPTHSTAQLRQVHKILRKSKKPMMIIGSQAMLVSSTPVMLDRTNDPTAAARVYMNKLADAIRSIGVPCYLAGMARGLLGPESEVQLYHKRREACADSDLVILLGIGCDFRLDYGQVVSRSKKMISVNRSREDLKLGIRVADIQIQGDPACFTLALAEMCKQQPLQQSWGDWLADLKARDRQRENQIVKEAQQAAMDRIHNLPLINPIAFLQNLEKAIAADAILVLDGGDFVGSAAYILRPRGPLSWLDPGVFGTLGVGGGFAVGAAAVKPRSEVWIVWGDGSAGYSLAEYDTCVRHQLPILSVIGNDACWSQIERDQTEILGDNVGCMLSYTDYHQVAEGYGGKGLLLTQSKDADAILAQAKRIADQGRPVCVNVHIGITQFRKGSISM